jgi:ubiquinone/menaquinone biosynthesis C-methylase UbiE
VKSELELIMRHLHPRVDMFGLVDRPERYRRLTSGPFRRVHARVVTDVVAAGLPAGARVLDIGTGPGGVPISIAETVTWLRIDGVDLSAAMIAHARKTLADSDAHDRVTFSVGDAAALPYPNETFDLVVSSMSQHHWADVPAAMREIRRVLGPGGRAWIYDARIALHQAKSAARELFAAQSVRSEPIQTTRLPIRPFGRLSVEHRSPR